MRRHRLLALGLGFAAAVAMAAGEPEQTIEPLTPPVEQRIEILHPATEQRVEMLDAQGVQQISGNATDSAARRGAKAVGKVVLTVVGAAVAIGGMLAALLFI